MPERREGYPPVLQGLHDQGIINLDRLEELREEGVVNPGVYNKLRRTGAVAEDDFDKLGGQAVLEQIVNVDVLERLRDEGVVDVEGDVRQALSGARRGQVSAQRWAVIFGDFFIFAAYDW